MLNRYIIPAVIYFVLLIVQLNLVPYIAIGSIIPDLILILLVYLTLKNGQLYGTVLGFMFGFFFDLFSGGIIGAAMFSKTLAGFVTGYFFNENKIDISTSSFPFIIIVFLASSIDTFLYSVLPIKNLNIAALDFIFTSGFFPGFYTAVVSIPIILIKTSRSIHE